MDLRIGLSALAVLHGATMLSLTYGYKGRNPGRYIEDLDVILMVDSSGSIGRRNWLKVQACVKTTVDLVSSQGPHNRVAVIVYSSSAHLKANFEDYPLPREKQNYFHAIANYIHLKGFTFIDKALVLAASAIAPIARPTARKLAILMTDGVQTIHVEPYYQAAVASKLLKDKGFTVLAIGIGNDIDFSELYNAASGDGLVFPVKDMSELRLWLPDFHKIFDKPVIRLKGKSSSKGVVYVEDARNTAPLCFNHQVINPDDDVICRVLGFNDTQEASSLPFPTNQSQKGFEVRLNTSCSTDHYMTKPESCLIISRNLTNCTHMAERVCRVPVRLRGLNIPYAGLVEVFFNGYWGAIGQDGWNKKNSDVVCKQLGFRKAAAIFINVKITGDDIVQQFLRLQCQGNEKHIFDCPGQLPYMTINKAVKIVCLPAKIKQFSFKQIALDRGAKNTIDCTDLLGGQEPTGWRNLYLQPIRRCKNSGDRICVTSTNSLVFTKAKIEDAETYLCRGTTNWVIYVVYARADIHPRSKKIEEIQYIQYHSTVTIDGCNARGKPDPVIKWLKNGFPFTDTSFKQEEPYSDKWKLHDVEFNDKGNYTCTVTQQIEDMETLCSMYTQLYVYDFPSFSIKPTDLITQEGQTAKFVCKASGTPKPTIQWSFTGSTSAQTSKTLNVTYHTLVVYNVSKERDEGRYTCTAELKEASKKRSVSVTLTVDVLPAVLPGPKYIVFKEGSNMTLSCSVSGSPLPQVTWKTDSLSHINQAQLLRQNRTLHITKISRKHEGLYTCMAVNRVGSTNSSTFVHISFKVPLREVQWYVIAGPILAGIALCAVLSLLFWHWWKKTKHMKEIREFQVELEGIEQECDEWELLPCNLFMQNFLGIGSFGEVWSALAQGLKGASDGITVAVKKLKRNSTEVEKNALLCEINLGKSLGNLHPNIVNFLGCVTQREPTMLIMEYVPYGDLLGYLRKSRGLDDKYYSSAEMCKVEINNYDMISFARQIASGMSYLTSKKILHRDLAARNLLVGKNNTCKITDFGLAFSKSMYTYGTNARKGRLPIKWSAPELMFSDSKFAVSYKCDVWSYGIVLFEIFTLGGVPYQNWGEYKVIFELKANRYRLPQPEHISKNLYQIMMDCWNEDPSDRPNFEQLHDTMLEILEEQHSLDVDMTKYQGNMYLHVDEGAVSLENFDEDMGIQPSNKKPGKAPPKVPKRPAKRSSILQRGKSWRKSKKKGEGSVNSQEMERSELEKVLDN